MRKRLVVSMILLFLFLLVSPTFAAPAVVFSDDFNGADGPPGPAWTVVSGTWANESGELSGSGPAYLYKTYIVAGDTSWTDYTMEAKINIKEDLSGPGAPYAPYDDSKVVFRWTGMDNCYQFVISYGIQRIRIFKVVGGVEASISDKPYAVYLNTNYNIKIEVVGSSIKAYVNGVLELDCIDTSLANGKIGLGVDREHTHFDDVVVENPGSPDPVPGMPEFEIGLPIMTSVAAAAYMLIRQRLGKRKE